MNLLETISDSSDALFQVSGIHDFEDLVQILQDPLQESSAWGLTYTFMSWSICWIPSNLFIL